MLRRLILTVFPIMQGFHPDNFMKYLYTLLTSAILGVTSATAATVGHTFTGVTVDNLFVSDAIRTEFPGGTRWTVRVEWDSAAPYTGLSTNQSGFALTKFTVTLEGKGGTWTTSSLPGKASFSLGQYEGSHEIQFTSGFGPENHTNPVIEDVAPYSINVTLTDPTGTAISSLESTPTGVDLSKWSDSEFKIYLNESGTSLINGPVDLTTVVKGPEIGVKASGNKDLKDGKSTSNFGTAKEGKKGKVLKYTITNSGDASLKGIKVALAGADKGDFKITKSASSKVARGKSTTFEVTFKPRKKGKRKAEIRISSNDADEKEFNIKLKGVGK